jgi:hypothetical protein
VTRLTSHEALASDGLGSRSIAKERFVSNLIAVALLVVCAFVSLGTARAVLTLALNLMAKTNLQR